MYISTTIPFVNGTPHVGFAYELVLADALARTHRLRGRTVHFQSGTDDHSLKSVRAADAAGLTPGELVAVNGRRFVSLAEVLGLSLDDFIHTSSDARHRRAVERLWRACVKRGDIYRRGYRGLYCVGCERFVTEKELVAGQCPEHRVAPEIVEEENYFFRLSRYVAPIREAVESGQLQVKPPPYRALLLRQLVDGVEDLSISRSAARARGFGIPVPNDPEQVVYVWFDALTNYISTLGYGLDPTDRVDRWASAYGLDPTDRVDRWASAGRRVHVLGKGVLRFHGLYWPALLLSAGLPLPDELLVHGYLTAEGRKISKSLGNAVDPFALVDQFGQDALRYALLRGFRTHQDGDFSPRRVEALYASDLVNGLGNLVGRVAGLLLKYRGGVIPSAPPATAGDRAVHTQAAALLQEVDAAWDRFEPDVAVAAVFALVRTTDRYLAREAPWTLVRSGEDARFDQVLSTARAAVEGVTRELRPLLPSTAERIEARFREGAVHDGSPLFARPGLGRAGADGLAGG